MPGIHVVTIIQLPGFPVERFGLLLTLPWLIAIYTTLAIYLYLLCYGFTQVIQLKNVKIAIYVFTALSLIIGYFVPNTTFHDQLRIYFTIGTPAFAYILPILTLCLAAIRKKGEVKK
ncbi:MAG TPA: GerAB/ArcD/ProY family transporter [Bacillota bacterium]|nr:GerAB/ArcD/ProY family transporter [Bacillota bacterium]